MTSVPEGLRVLGDPVADEVAEALARERATWPTNALLSRVRTNTDALPPTVPPIVRRFFDEAGRLPSWANPERMARAASWADAHLPYLSVSLLAASLPVLFTGAKGAAVLHATRRLIDDVDRRINETGRFVLDVVAKDGFGPRGSAIVSSLKVRLVHASVRVSVKEKLGNHAEVPINQEDMLGTLMAFSVVALRASERLGLRIAKHEAEDYWHLWRVAGHLMGVDERFVPRDVDSARALEGVLTARIAEPSEHGRLLAAALLEGMQRHVPVPGLETLPARLVRYLVGDHLADALAVPPTPRASTRWLRGATWFQQRAPDLVATVGPLFARRLHEAIVRAKLRDDAPDFRMPRGAG